MKKILLILFLFSVPLCAPSSTTIRYGGVVREVKALGVDVNDNVVCWISADNKIYVTKTKSYMPRIYIGDTLFEYWINYRRSGVGTSKGNRLYEILNYTD